MASRKSQKDAARERRLAEERAAALAARRNRRLQMIGGVIAAAVVIVVVLVVVSSGSGGKGKTINPTSPQATAAVATVNKLLSGIPQQGNTLGSPKARVTLTEYGDLVCPVCKDFALGAESQLISNDVRAGKVKIVYKALETASLQANNAMFVPSQTAALAAGQQKLGWNYIELFYHEQGDELKSYVTTSYLEGLAKQISPLSLSRWSSDRSSSTLSAQVSADAQTAQNQGFNSTPTLVAQGPVSAAKPIAGNTTYANLEHAIKSVY